MDMLEETPIVIYLQDLPFEIMLYKQVFKNNDGWAGEK
jgi:hypothetical protein